MSSFNGSFSELENVLVDNFSSYKSFTCFFLSHCHTDHMKDLGNLLLTLMKKPDQFLYCSPISRLIVLNDHPTYSLEGIIKPLHSTTVIVVPENEKSPSYEITVTPIPAGHCPGSVMFLFETANRSILFTGDFRIAKNDIQKFKRLHRNNEVISIDKLYFDATFLNESYWNFPQRSEVVRELKRPIRNWLDEDVNNHVFLLTSAYYGYEYVFTELAKEFKCKIHVPKFIYNLYVKRFSVPEVGIALTDDSSETKIHAGINFQQLQINPKEYNSLLIRLSAKWYKSPKESGSEPIWNKIDDNYFRICYSNHCSCSELIFFLNYLRPKKLQPFTSTMDCSVENVEEYIRKLVWSWPLKDNNNVNNNNKRLKIGKDESDGSKKSQNIKIQFPNILENYEKAKEFFMEELL